MSGKAIKRISDMIKINDDFLTPSFMNEGASFTTWLKWFYLKQYFQWLMVMAYFKRQCSVRVTKESHKSSNPTLNDNPNKWSQQKSVDNPHLKITTFRPLFSVYNLGTLTFVIKFSIHPFSLTHTHTHTSYFYVHA